MTTRYNWPKPDSPTGKHGYLCDCYRCEEEDYGNETAWGEDDF